MLECCLQNFKLNQYWISKLKLILKRLKLFDFTRSVLLCERLNHPVVQTIVTFFLSTLTRTFSLSSKFDIPRKELIIEKVIIKRSKKIIFLLFFFFLLNFLIGTILFPLLCKYIINLAFLTKKF